MYISNTDMHILIEFEYLTKTTLIRIGFPVYLTSSNSAHRPCVCVKHPKIYFLYVSIRVAFYPFKETILYIFWKSKDLVYR